MPKPRVKPLLLLLLASTLPATALADEVPTGADAAAMDPTIAEARAEFQRGAGHVDNGEWAEAMAAFERSNAVLRHAVTTFNIGSCQRAMGFYARSRQTFERALQENATAGGRELSTDLVAQIAAFDEELDRILVVVSVELQPADAAIAVDGRPLELIQNGTAKPTLLADVLPPGKGQRPPAAKFDIRMDPGAHVFTLSRKGFGDAVVNKAFKPGAAESMTLALDRLPATLKIASNRDSAVVTVNGDDVGTTPKTVERPGGAYTVTVKKKGFVTYSTRVAVGAGEAVDIKANLPEDKPGLHERWWFWGGLGVLVTGAVVVTYAATRPAPERPGLNGGGLGWSIDLR